MAKSGGKGILLFFGLVAIAGIAYVTISGRGAQDEGIEATIGAQHQSAKTQYYTDLNKKLEDADNVETLGRIAALFETDVAEAEKMLREKGWSKEEFDKMIVTVRRDEALNRVFEAAKVASRD